jgi:hypothetical protein
MWSVFKNEEIEKIDLPGYFSKLDLSKTGRREELIPARIENKSTSEDAS